jgi:hypothetical protein
MVVSDENLAGVAVPTCAKDAHGRIVTFVGAGDVCAALGALD